MKLSDPIKIALRSLVAAKTRFFLTVMGIVIGVAAVIVVMAVGASAQALVLAQIQKVGTNLIVVLPGASEENGPPAQALGIITTSFTLDDVRALRKKSNVPHLEAFAGYVTGSGTLESRAATLESSFQGVSPSMIDVEAMRIREGRFFFPEEESDLSRVVVLGATRAEELFPQSNALGETITINDNPFRVVGVLEARGSAAFSTPDTLVYVPLVTAQKILLGINYINFGRGKVDRAESIDVTRADITSLLRDRHHLEEEEESDFSVRSTTTALALLTNVTNVLKYFLISIASLSLVVGGIGIMNSMLIAVSQRVREVGLRKAVGARPIHIVIQFLIESAFIALLGGVLGVVIGVALAFGAAIIIPRLGYSWEFFVPPLAIALGFFVSLIIGVTFGLYPAFRAAKISPMEALRYE